MKRHKVAVIGCGALAQGVHLPNVRNNPRMDLVCACDINGTVAEECAERFQARRAETDWRKVAEAKDVDIIILATQHNLTNIEGKGENPCDIEDAIAVNQVTLKLPGTNN